LLKLAEQASMAFRTDTAIADYLEPPDVSTDQFLLLTPERQYFELMQLRIRTCLKLSW